MLRKTLLIFLKVLFWAWGLASLLLLIGVLLKGNVEIGDIFFWAMLSSPIAAIWYGVKKLNSTGQCPKKHETKLSANLNDEINALQKFSSKPQKKYKEMTEVAPRKLSSSSDKMYRWEQLQSFPYWQYHAIFDCLACKDFDGQVKHSTDPFWQTFYPPNGLDCHCYVIGMSEVRMKMKGLKLS